MDGVATDILEQYGAETLAEWFSANPLTKTRCGRYDRGDGGVTGFVDLRHHGTYRAKGWTLIEVGDEQKLKALAEARA